jgi:hypothetical protein
LIIGAVHIAAHFFDKTIDLGRYHAPGPLPSASITAGPSILDQLHYQVCCLDSGTYIEYRLLVKSAKSWCMTLKCLKGDTDSMKIWV